MIMEISNPAALVDCRRQAAELAAASGLSRGVQTRLVTAVSEMSRAMLLHCSGVSVTFSASGQVVEMLGQTPQVPRVPNPGDVPSLEGSAEAVSRLVEIHRLAAADGSIAYRLSLRGAPAPAPAPLSATSPAENVRPSMAVAASGAGVLSWDSAADILATDGQAKAILTLDDGSSSLATLLERVHPDDCGRLAAELTAAESIDTVFRVVPGDGGIRDINLRGGTVHDGRRRVFAGLCLDVTDYHAQQRMRRTQGRQRLEAIGELAGAMAHEINNLLQPIVGIVDMMREEAPPGTDVRDDLDVVADSARQAAAIIRNVLVFARQDDGAPWQEVSCALAIDAALRFIKPLLPPTIRLDVRLPEKEEGRARLRATDIQQVLTNLITNAAHAMDGAGTITIELSRRDLQDTAALALQVPAGTYFNLLVRDHGRGMDPDTQNLMFEPFFTTKPIGQGTGLGLSVVFGIVRSCGGSITAVSSMGRGTTFSLLFPLLG